MMPKTKGDKNESHTYFEGRHGVMVAASCCHHGDQRAVLVDNGRAGQVAVGGLEGGCAPPLRQLAVAGDQ
ncbi:jg11159 [Pararge aegeria aegeria]|uniref:Jg11159 protein n=1 Tax=Pararge aegeria aegeria TaxID=348720 RepID=A0A8S4RIE0_9NEOP|nr:jg11159 [Pararge aegeria aegeria]